MRTFILKLDFDEQFSNPFFSSLWTLIEEKICRISSRSCIHDVVPVFDRQMNTVTHGSLCNSILGILETIKKFASCNHMSCSNRNNSFTIQTTTVVTTSQRVHECMLNELFLLSSLRPLDLDGNACTQKQDRM